MRDRAGRATLAAMKNAAPRQRLTLDAAIDRSVIQGTLTASTGARRDFHGWLELSTALEAILDTRAGRPPSERRGASTAVPAKPRATQAGPPATKSVDAPPGHLASRPAPAAQ
jgi:hypothetical protein